MAAVKKAPKPRAPLEDAEMAVLAQWLDWKRIRWCHVPNGGHRDVRVGRKMKELGTKRGVPDVLIFDRPRRLPESVGVAIELKRNDHTCKASPEQVEWLDALRDRGWHTEVCHGAAEAIALLCQLGF